MATTTVLVCRHGETEWNNKRQFQGSADIPLNSTGREQARRLAAVIKSRNVSAVWTSPMIRAHATAVRVADHCNVALRIDERLAERDLGIMQGMPYQEVKTSHPKIWAAWRAFEPLPEEARAEPNERVVSRVESALFEIGQMHPGGTVALVGHAGTLRALLGKAGNVGNASITTLLVGPGARWRLVGVDGQEHLASRALRLGDLSEPPAASIAQSSLPVTTLMLCRHGESEGNKAKIFQGHMDLPLSAAGRQQARLMGRALQSLGLAALWTSSLARAWQTAEEIGAAVGVLPWADSRLRERHLGRLQGMNHNDVKNELPETWKAWKGYLPLPEDAAAEPQEQVSERLESAFFHLASTYPGKTVAIVIHGANARCLLRRSIGNGSITTIQLGPGREWHVTKIGDFSHLPPELSGDAAKASKL